MERSRQAGRKYGKRGAECGVLGGRPRKQSEPGSASQSTKKGVLRPAKWEPEVGHQFLVVKFIREQLRMRRLGKFTPAGWQEPEAEDVEVQVWTEIRQAGFGGRSLKNRDLTRLWSRRATIAQQVQALELGRTGGIYKRMTRTSGASREACSGGGQRSMVQLVEESGEEGGEEKGRCKKSVRYVSAMKPIFVEVKKTFENWRMGGHYVDSEDFYNHSVA